MLLEYIFAFWKEINRSPSKASHRRNRNDNIKIHEQYISKTDINRFHIFRMPMPEIVEDPRYEGLDEADRAKVGNNVSSNYIVSNQR